MCSEVILEVFVHAFNVQGQAIFSTNCQLTYIALDTPEPELSDTFVGCRLFRGRRFGRSLLRNLGLRFSA